MKIAIVINNNIRVDDAKLLATKLNLPIVDVHEPDFDFFLEYTQDYLQLRWPRHFNYHVDFVGGKQGYRRQHGGGYRQLIARAVGIKPGKSLTILDATAGFAADAFTLACLGGKMTLLEQSPIVATLLQDGIERLQQYDVNIAMQLLFIDAQSYLRQCVENKAERFDVIYLDPMYPPRDKSALVKKPMQLLQQLVDIKQDEHALLQLALALAKKRVVVKRPSWAEIIGDIKPDVCYRSKNTRYDTYHSPLSM